MAEPASQNAAHETNGQHGAQAPKTVTLRLKDGTLIASGQASCAWLAKARQIADVIPGVTQWREDRLTEIQNE